MPTLLNSFATLCFNGPTGYDPNFNDYTCTYKAAAPTYKLEISRAVTIGVLVIVTAVIIIVWMRKKKAPESKSKHKQ